MSKEYRCETKLKTTSFNWNINNFSSLLEIGADSYLESPIFEGESGIAGVPLHWQLFFCLRVNGDFCSLHAEISGESGVFRTFVKLAILDYKGRIAILKKNKENFDLDMDPEERACGSNKFVRYSYLTSQKNRLYPNDCLTIFCQITLITNEMSLVRDDTFIGRHSIMTDLKDALNKPKLLDVMIFIKNDVLKASRFILSARSTVFASMLQKFPNLIIEDIELDIMKLVLEFMYTDNCENIKEMATSLYLVAKKYGIPALKERCELEMCSKINSENFYDYFLFAKNNSAEVLKRNIVEYVQRNKESLEKTKPEIITLLMAH